MPAKDELKHIDDNDTLRHTAEIVASYAGANRIAPEQLPELIRSVHAALAGLTTSTPEQTPERPKPAAPINKSVQHDYIICLEDGKRLKMLKRHLRSTYNLSPDQYRKRWGLTPDYPMVAPAYAARRSAFAKSIGLGKGARKKA